MSDFLNRKFDVSLTGEEILFLEYLMIDKLSALKSRADSRKIYDRVFDKFLTIKTKNKFFESYSMVGGNKTKLQNSDITESLTNIYSGKYNSTDMYQRREVLSFADFVKVNENNITPINPEIKAAAKREEGDVNYDRKNINMITPMDDSSLKSNGQNQEPGPDDIQKKDVKEADEMNKEADKLNKDAEGITQPEQK